VPKKIDITPSTEILHATARTGYTWSDAIFELVDNGVDAIRAKYEKAPTTARVRRMRIRIHPIPRPNTKRTSKIIVSDNGTGIEKSFLESGDIFSMGNSKTRTESTVATGAFGMGMKSAAQTLGTKLRILTTTTDVANLVGAEIDFDNVIESGTWEAEFFDGNSITEEDRKLYRNYAGRKSGTVIVIEGAEDKVPTTQGMTQTLRNKVAHCYRHLLSSDSKLGYDLPFKVYIGAKCDSPVQCDWDPLCVSHDRTNVFIGDKSGNFKEYEFKGYKVRVRLTHTQIYKGERARSVDGLATLGAYQGGVIRQGAYYIRNGREIAAQSLWKHSSAAGNLYAEISFVDAGRDRPDCKTFIKTDYGKKGIVIEDEFDSYMRKYIFDPWVKKLGQEARAQAAKVTKGSRDNIKKMIEKTTLPADKFGRARQTPEKRAANRVQNIFNKSVKKNLKAPSAPSRTNSKYRGTSINAGENDIEIKLDEEAWRGSPFPYNVEFTVGEPYVRVIFNVLHPWIKKSIYENTNANEVTRNMQLAAANCVSLMYETDDTKDRIIQSQGDLLNLFDEDFGSRIEKEIENLELEKTNIYDCDQDISYSDGIAAEAK